MVRRNRWLGVLAFAGAIAAAPAWATTEAVFEKTEGTWKARCTRHVEQSYVFCQAFAIRRWGEQDMANFLQFGAGWTRDGVTALVIATYLGFQQDSQIEIRVDENAPVRLTVPGGPRYQAEHAVAQPVIRQLETGAKVAITFRPKLFTKARTEVFDLKAYQALLVDVKSTLAENDPGSPRGR